MIKPNLFIVGAAKAGTTSIFHYIEQSNQVFTPKIKEPNYFCSDLKYNSFRKNYKKDLEYNLINFDIYKHSAWIDDMELYQKLFDTNSSFKISLEGSVSYLYSKDAAKNIYDFNPAAKIIIILRNPIERAFSHYLMNLQVGYAKDSFIKEVLMDFNQFDKGWGKTHLYIELGLYYEQVKRYLDLFPDSQVEIILFEDIKNDLTKTIEHIYDFLDIIVPEQLDHSQHNISVVPKSPGTYMMLKKIYKKLDFIKLDFIKKKIIESMLSKDARPKLCLEDRKKLLPYFRQDIQELSKLININLDDWVIDE